MYFAPEPASRTRPRKLPIRIGEFLVSLPRSRLFDALFIEKRTENSVFGLLRGVGAGHVSPDCRVPIWNTGDRKNTPLCITTTFEHPDFYISHVPEARLRYTVCLVPFCYRFCFWSDTMDIRPESRVERKLVLFVDDRFFNGY